MAENDRDHLAQTDYPDASEPWSLDGLIDQEIRRAERESARLRTEAWVKDPDLHSAHGDRSIVNGCLIIKSPGEETVAIPLSYNQLLKTA